MRVVITGANRGIGLEFTRQYLRRGATVEATARDPGRAHQLKALAAEYPQTLRVHRCDVRSEEMVRALASEVGPRPVDLLINNAGVIGEREPLHQLDLEDVQRCFEVNAVGPLRVVKALLPALSSAGQAKVVNITSRMGSIEDNTSGGYYAYRLSKAALNMATRSMALDLAGLGIVCVVLHPGWVRTEMGGPSATVPVSEAVGALTQLIERLGPEHNGQFYNLHGEPLPW